MNNLLVISHKNCPDGFSAAWAARRKHPDAEIFFTTHGDSPPDVSGRDVVIVDFCYPRDILMQMKIQANSLLVLDHHKTSLEECGDLPYCIFDMNRSGAGMSWDWFFPTEARPWLIDYIEYRDLGGIWHNATHPWQDYDLVMAGLDSYERTFENWDKFAATDPSVLCIEGKVIERYKDILIKQILSSKEEITINGQKVFIVNSSVLQSEVANYLAQSREFGLCWHQNAKHIKISLRVADSNTDVEEIAKAKGGGGHKRASSFVIPRINIEKRISDD